MRAIFVVVAILFVTLGGKAFSAQGLSPQQAAPPQIWESREEMHDDYVQRFESAAGFGMSRMLRPPMLDRSGTLDTGRSRYAIEALELVGHLQTDTPAAYVPTAHDASLRLSFDSRATGARALDGAAARPRHDRLQDAGAHLPQTSYRRARACRAPPLPSSLLTS